MGIIKNYQDKGNCKVTFSYPLSPDSDVKSIQVLGDFNNWDSNSAPKLKKGKDAFNTSFELACGNTYQFRYLLDGTKWVNDFEADGYAQSPYPGINNSVLILNAILKTEQTPSKTLAPQIAKAKKVEEGKSDKANIVKEGKKTTPKLASKVTATKEVKIASTKSVNVPVIKPTKSTIAIKTGDDLKKIEGIGPKIAEILVSKGIATFKDLAKAKVASLKKILDEAGPKFNVHDPATWSQQAQLAANNKWTELKTLQDALNAGKVKK